MKRILMTTTVIALGLSMGPGAAVARDDSGPMPGPRGPVMHFEEIDTDGDGLISREDMEAHAKARFDAADTNGDGALSADELQAAAEQRQKERMSKRSQRMIKHRDANGDGVLSFDEMQPKGDRAARMFDKVDTDGDGMISKDEMEAMAKKHGDRRAEMKKRHQAKESGDQ